MCVVNRPWCRMCLDTDVRMCELDAEEQQTFENVTKLKLCEDGLPRTVCFVCHSQVLRCGRVAARAAAAARALRALAAAGLQITFETIEKLGLGKQNQYLSVLALEPLIIEMKHVKGLKKDTKNESFLEGDNTRDKDKENANYRMITKVITKNDTTVYAEKYDEETLTEEKLAKEELIKMGESMPKAIVNNIVIKLEHEAKEESDLEEKPTVEDLTSFEADNVDVQRDDIIDFKEGLIDIEENIIYDDVGSPSTLLEIDDQLVNDIRNINVAGNIETDMSTLGSIQNINLIPKFEFSDEDESEFESKEGITLEQERSNDKEQSLLIEYTSSNVYRCHYCDKHYHTKQGIAKHLKLHTKQDRKKAFTCTICDKTVSRECNLRMHMKIHREQSTESQVVKRSNAILKIKKKKTVSSELKTQKDDEAGHIFQCDECNEAFDSRDDIVSHIKNPTHVQPVCSPENSIETTPNTTTTSYDDSVFECDICKETFASKNDIITHIKSHTQAKSQENPIETNLTDTNNENVLTCDDCNNKYAYRCDLIAHIRSHLYIQSRIKQLDERAIHSKSKRSKVAKQEHTCKNCKRTFYQHWACVRHMKLCSWIYRPREANKCQCCRKNITFDKPLINYMTFSKGHPNPYYECEECIKLAKLRKTIDLSKALDKFTCRICAESFTEKDNFERHEILHEDLNVYPCIKCDEQFATTIERNIHMNSHVREKRFGCKHCEKTFAYEGHFKTHMNVHSGANLYTCDQCNRTFAHKGAFSSHLTSHRSRMPRMSIRAPIEVLRQRRQT